MTESEGFLLSPYMAEVFYRTCAIYKITDYNERIRLMRKFVIKKKATYLRNSEEFLQGKKVLHIERRNECDN